MQANDKFHKIFRKKFCVHLNPLQRLFSNTTRQEERSDEALLQEYQATNNAGVLAVLFDRYLHLVYGVCLKYLKNREDARDTVSAIFERLLAVASEQSVDNFRPWLYVLAKNHCLMHLRRQNTVLRHEAEFFATESMENHTPVHPIDEEEADNHQQLKKCIESLKLTQRECIERFYFSDQCYRDIASQMQLDEKEVKSHIQNGKRNLKICLEAHE